MQPQALLKVWTTVESYFSGTPLNDHLYKATTLEIRPLWFSPKSMYTCIMVLRIKTTLKIRSLFTVWKVVLFLRFHCIKDKQTSLWNLSNEDSAYGPSDIEMCAKLHTSERRTPLFSEHSSLQQTAPNVSETKRCCYISTSFTGSDLILAPISPS